MFRIINLLIFSQGFI